MNERGGALALSDPLNREVYKFCQQVRPEDSTENSLHNNDLCRCFSEFLAKENIPASDVARAIRSCFDEPIETKTSNPNKYASSLENSDTWVEWMLGREIFSYEKIPTDIVRPRNELAISKPTSIQSANTLLQPDKMSSSDSSSSLELYENELTNTQIQTMLSGSTDILLNTAVSDMSSYVWSKAGVGASTFLRAIVAMTLLKLPETKLKIIDLGSFSWLGFQVDSDIVVQACPGTEGCISELEDMLAVTEAVKEISSEYRKRTKLAQKASTEYRRDPKFYPISLVINEYNTLFFWLSTFDKASQKLKNFKELAKSKGIQNPLLPKDIPAVLSMLFMVGSDKGIRVLACGQEIAEKKTGFTPAALDNTNIVSLGRVSNKNDGGYSTPRQLINNPARFPDPRVRKYLLGMLDAYALKAVPFSVTTQGMGGGGYTNDHSGLYKESSVANYRHGPVKSNPRF